MDASATRPDSPPNKFVGATRRLPVAFRTDPSYVSVKSLNVERILLVELIAAILAILGAIYGLFSRRRTLYFYLLRAPKYGAKAASVMYGFRWHNDLYYSKTRVEGSDALRVTRRVLTNLQSEASLSDRFSVWGTSRRTDSPDMKARDWRGRRLVLQIEDKGFWEVSLLFHHPVATGQQYGYLYRYRHRNAFVDSQFLEVQLRSPTRQLRVEIFFPRVVKAPQVIVQHVRSAYERREQSPGVVKKTPGGFLFQWASEYVWPGLYRFEWKI